jgi:N-acetyl-anhydromuramyl-L-alanine amidase AmpD
MEQKIRVKELIRYLMKTFNIPKENVLRHADLTWS